MPNKRRELLQAAAALAASGVATQASTAADTAMTTRAAGRRPPWTCDENHCSDSRTRVPTRIGCRSPLRGAPRRLLASLSLGANRAPSGGRGHSVAAKPQAWGHTR